MNESGDEEESDAIVNQVLEEIGIDIGSKVNSISNFFLNNNHLFYNFYLKVAGAPSALSGTIGTTVRQPMTDTELEESLAKLRSN